MMTQTTPPDPNTYYLYRLEALGLSEDMPGFTRDQGLPDEPFARGQVSLLYPDADGNICIPYLGLDGQQVRYKKTDNPGNPMTVGYMVKRLRQPKDDKKYQNPIGQPNQIYLTPAVIDAYQEKQHVQTLYIVEGQFKALAGWAAGLHIVGISGFSGWKATGKPQLRDTLRQLIGVCRPNNVVLLLDADTREVKAKHLEEGKDLAARIRNFYSAVDTFRRVMLGYESSAWFAQVHEGWLDEAKGLDDLLHLKRQRGLQDDVIAALHPQQLSTETNSYFQGCDLTAFTAAQLKNWFRLGSVDLFYNSYAGLIGMEEFVWQRGRYQFSEDWGKVRMQRHPDTDKFKRIGTDWYMRITHKTQLGEAISVLEPWKKTAITEDYEKKISEQIIKQAERFHAYCNVPKNQGDYQGEYLMPDGTRLYNLYQEPPQRPQPYPTNEPGDDIEPVAWPHIPHIYQFVRHVFGDQPTGYGHPRWVLAMDWLSVVWRQPSHKLPVIVLLSEANETGKSTFIDLLMLMLGENVVRIGNDDFHDNYNSHYISRLVAGIEEGLIEKEAVKEKLKALTTAPTATMEAKFVNKSRVDCILKFIITTNRWNFMRLDPTDERFLVVEVPRLREEQKDPDLLEKMAMEIPYFLHYLENRKIVHPRENRLWFGFKTIRTKEFQRCTQDSLPAVQRGILQYIRDYFFEYQTTDCYLTFKEVMIEVLNMKGQDRAYIKKILTENMALPEPRKTTVKRAHTQNSDNGLFWHFRAQDFLSPSEVDEIKRPDPNSPLPF